jgi:hypothetical protein
VWCVSEECGVATTAIYDFKKQKHKLLNFYSDSDDQKLMKYRKTLQRAKSKILLFLDKMLDTSPS